MKSNPAEHTQDTQASDKVKKFIKSPFIYLLIPLVLLLISYMIMPTASQTKQITYSEFLQMMDKGEVESVEVAQDGTLAIKPKSDTLEGMGTTYVTTVVDDAYLVDQMRAHSVQFSAATESQSVSIFIILFNYILPFALYGLMIFGMVMMVRNARKNAANGVGGGSVGAFGIGKSNAKQYDMQSCETKFSDVAGQDEAKASLMEIVDILKNPTRYTSVGAELPKGALLVGPPGTGKTLLAKAVAGEAGCPFFFVSGSAFVEMFVGQGAARVRDLFRQAAELAPCIVFIDEIDAIGKKRDSVGIGGNDEREQTLNQLLTEMDGFDPEKGIIVLGATNRPEILDKALLRPGRFDRRVPVELPDMKGREEILQVHARKKKLAPNVNLRSVAYATPGASGADLANILNEAALTAVRNNRDVIEQSDLDHATEYVIAGDEKKSMVISPDEKRIIAYHEIGHALVGALQKNAVPIRKITIIPRTSGALGFTMQADEEDHVLMKKDDLLNRLEVLTAGRAAEELIFNTCTSGASNDIERATELARSMITRFGMSENIGLITLDTVSSPYLDGNLRANCSEATANEVEREIKQLIKTAYDNATNTLRENSALLNRLSEYLLVHENITGEEFSELMGMDNAVAC